MKIQVIERSQLHRLEWSMELSDATHEAITQSVEYARINFGHDKAEEVAKEIRELIESKIGEAELLKKVMLDEWCNQTKAGRSAILIIRTLDQKNLKESTVQRVLSIILEANKKFGVQASEQMATLLIPIVEESENDEELLLNISHFEVTNSYFK